MRRTSLFTQVILITLGFIALLKVGRLWRLWLNSYISSQVELDLIAGIITRFTILIVLLLILRKYQFKHYISLSRLKYSENLQAVVISLVFISAGFFSNLNTYASAGIYLLSIFIMNTMLVALIEELTFRGLVLPLILKIRKRKRHRVFVSVVFTAVIFGLLHYVNLFRQPENFSGITSQVIFATSIGIFLGGLMLRTCHIFLPVIIHFLINFSFGSGELGPDAEDPAVESSGSSGFDTGTLITLLFFLFIAAGGWYMTRKADKDYLFAELDKEDRDLVPE